MKVIPARSPGAAESAADLVRSGGLVVFPTDTTYAIGVDAHNGAAVERLFRVKGREGGKTLSIAFPSISRVEAVAHVTDAARRVMLSLLPGPLTLVLPARPACPRAAISEAGFVGIRIPDSIFCRRFLLAAGGPVTSTSANPSGAAAAIRVEDLGAFPAAFRNGVDAVFDDGPSGLGVASTVVQMDSSGIRVLREGVVSLAAIQDAAEGGGSS